MWGTTFGVLVVPTRAVNLSIDACCTEFRCEQLCDDDILGDRGQIFYFFTKRVAVRAVELFIGALCTDFLCEQLCDDDMVSDLDRIWDVSRKGLQ